MHNSQWPQQIHNFHRNLVFGIKWKYFIYQCKYSLFGMVRLPCRHLRFPSYKDLIHSKSLESIFQIFNVEGTCVVWDLTAEWLAQQASMKYTYGFQMHEKVKESQR